MLHFDPIAFYTTQLPRLVAPLFPELLWSYQDDRKRAYLTFDDGPTSLLTEPILETLARYDARATFFVTGRNAERYPHLIERTLEEGHRLGNHTWSHPDAWWTAPDVVAKELDRTTELLTSLTGSAPRWMRPPYGHYRPWMRRWSERSGQQITMWDVMPADYYESQPAENVLARLERWLRPGSIVVLHDNPRCRRIYPEMLDRFLSARTKDGWTFEALPAV